MPYWTDTSWIMTILSENKTLHVNDTHHRSMWRRRKPMSLFGKMLQQCDSYRYSLLGAHLLHKVKPALFCSSQGFITSWCAMGRCDWSQCWVIQATHQGKDKGKGTSHQLFVNIIHFMHCCQFHIDLHPKWPAHWSIQTLALQKLITYYLLYCNIIKSLSPLRASMAHTSVLIFDLTSKIQYIQQFLNYFKWPIKQNNGLP